MPNHTPKSIQLPLPLDGEIIEIPLTKGYVAIVDAIDADLLSFKWYAQSCSYGHYAARRINSKQIILLHRCILGRMLNRSIEPSEQCDHIDRNRMNCLRSNLRIATVQQNSRNHGIGIANKSGFKGVAYLQRDRVWNSSICINGKTEFLGVYDTAEEAGIAYNHSALENFGEFAYLNDISGWENIHPKRRGR
jgi:hypothetical protein